MKKVLIFLIHALASLCIQGKVVVRTVFNPSSKEDFCLPSEWREMDAMRRRHLRELSSDSWAGFCDFYCRDYGPGYCWIYDEQCAVRRVEEIDNHEHTSREEELLLRGLSTDNSSPECVNEKLATKKVINHAIEQVSSNCQALLRSSKTMSCIDIPDEEPSSSEESDDDDCEITGFSLWDAEANEMLEEDAGSLQEFCSYDVELNIQAVATSCVDHIAFELQGPVVEIHTEFKAPFLVFGNVGKFIHGESLIAGSYELTATPDGDESKKKTFEFEVIDC